jgi:hypothetical protein
LPTTRAAVERDLDAERAVTVQSWLAGRANTPVLDGVSDDRARGRAPVAATSPTNANARSELIGVGDFVAAVARRRREQ